MKKSLGVGITMHYKVEAIKWTKVAACFFGQKIPHSKSKYFFGIIFLNTVLYNTVMIIIFLVFRSKRVD